MVAACAYEMDKFLDTRKSVSRSRFLFADYLLSCGANFRSGGKSYNVERTVTSFQVSVRSMRLCAKKKWSLSYLAILAVPDRQNVGD